MRLILPAGALSVPSMMATPSSVMLPPGSTDSVASDGIESWCAPLIEIEPSEALDKTSENSGKTPLASCGVQVEAVAKLKLPRPEGSAAASACGASTTLYGLGAPRPGLAKLMLSDAPDGI